MASQCKMPYIFSCFIVVCARVSLLSDSELRESCEKRCDCNLEDSLVNDREGFRVVFLKSFDLIGRLLKTQCFILRSLLWKVLERLRHTIPRNLMAAY